MPFSGIRSEAVYWNLKYCHYDEDHAYPDKQGVAKINTGAGRHLFANITFVSVVHFWCATIQIPIPVIPPVEPNLANPMVKAPGEDRPTD